MNSLRLYGKKVSQTKYSNIELKLEPTKAPELKGKDVLLRVAYCGLCGSDFHLTHSEQNNGIMDYPGLVKLPVTIGHEFSATIEKYGENVPESFQKQHPIGSAVTAEEMLWCGQCENCIKGNVNHCLHLEEIGFTHDGAHSEFLTIPYQYLHSIEPLLEKYGKEKGLQIGALIEPFSVAYRAIHFASGGLTLKESDSILVIGAGPIGIAVAEIAKLINKYPITALEPIKERKEFAEKRGLCAYYKPDELGSKLFDWIIDAAGSASTIQKVIENHTKASATICLLARCEHSLSISTEYMITKNLKIYGAQGHSGDETYKKVIELFSTNVIDVDSLIEEVIDLKQAYTRLIKQQKGFSKTLVNPRLESHD
ncbi:MAG: alcohol dehydrogenase catalytic domain-containing protein [Oligoflexia bacterium]|nr:alcohol dehydrogenase catalytic domain-containing protein [Oligoflexia bacterium]